MTRRILVSLVAVAMLIAARPVFAADIDGKWSGPLDTPMGTVPITITFKADGTTLTGSMTGMDGGEIAIADGKIDGEKVSFTVTIDFGGMALQLVYKGVVSATEIKMDLTVLDMPFSLVVSKLAGK